MKILIFLALINPFSQEPDSLLSEQKAIELALKYNFDIKLEKYNLSIAENNNTLGNAGILPTLGLNGNARETVQDTEQTFISGDSQSRNGAKTTVYSAGASLDWTLFDGFKMFATKDRLEEINKLNELTFKAQVQNTIANVSKAFYYASLEQERLALLESALKLSAERVQISKDKYELGKSSKMEYLQAQVDFNTDQSALLKQREVISRQKLVLYEIIGVVNQNMNFELSYDYSDELTSLELEEIESVALKRNPDLLRLKSQTEVSLLAKKELERGRYPSLDFNLGYNYSNLTSEAGFLQSNQSNGITYGLTAKVTLFDGLNQERSIQNAKIQAESTLSRYNQVEAQLLTAIRSAVLTLQNAEKLIGLEENNLDVAQENIEIALVRYRVGRSNPVEIREAQNNAVNAQIRYLEALNTAKIARIELMRLSGTIISD
ncbi:MAG: outer membrane protein [Marinoscillum sp.]|jgi:outer membrane protein